MSRPVHLSGHGLAYTACGLSKCGIQYANIGMLNFTNVDEVEQITCEACKTMPQYAEVLKRFEQEREKGDSE